MRPIPLIPAFSLALLCVGFAGEPAQAKKADRNLSSLCGGNGKVKVIRSSHVEHLASQLDDPSYEGACSGHVRKAVAELAELVRDERACSTQKAEALTKFYKSYIKETIHVAESKADTEHSDKGAAAEGAAEGADSQQVVAEVEREKLPKPLVDFLLAYALKTSLICRRHMLDTFLLHAKSKITKNDLKDLDFIIGTDSPIDRLLRAFVKPDEFLLPVDVFSTVPGSDQEHLYIRDSTSLQLLRAKDICELRLQPLYEEMLKPIAILARSGFDYRTLGMSANLKLFPHLQDDVFKWTKIFFMCESMKAVHINQEYSCTINLKTNEQGGAEIEKEVTKPLEDIVNLKGRQINELERYEPDKLIGDKIINAMDFQLKKAVETFDPTETSVQRLEHRITESALRILWEQSKSGNHLEALKKLIASIGSCGRDESLDKLKADLAKLLQSTEHSSLHSNFRDFFAVHRLAGKFVYRLVFYWGANLAVFPSFLLGETGASFRGLLENEYSGFKSKEEKVVPSMRL